MSEKKILINKDILQMRITQLSNEITNDYKNQEITFICILKGSMYFFVDLTKQVNLDSIVEVISVSSYEGENSTGKIKLLLGLKSSIKDKNVIIVEDIIDTGKTLTYLVNYLNKLNPKSLKICTLLSKPDRRTNNLKVDYIGFTIPNRFVFGYGLDIDEKYRCLPEIYCMTDDKDEDNYLNDVENIKKQLIKN